jgi:hypothetical protein
MTSAQPGTAYTLPQVGAVLGIDVGFSPIRRSSAVCRLDWDQRRIAWTISRFRAVPTDREETITRIAGSFSFEAAAFDGPLRAGFDTIGSYRTAERMLTARVRHRIGKPGQASAPVGKSLNAAANDCVSVVLDKCRLGPAFHAVRIDSQAVVEAFPSSFLGVMIEEPGSVAARRGNRSDAFYQHLVSVGTLKNLLARLLPRRACDQSMTDVTNHDDRAALVCAFTALAVAAGDFTAVGDTNGWIILPPRSFVRNWAWTDLEANARQEQPGCLYTTEPVQ